VFMGANHRSLGDTPQCGIVYGNKIYIGVYASNTIEVIDSHDFTSIKQIRLDENTGTQPRALLANGGKIYVSMYDGNIARLDTVSLNIEAKVKVGPNPETPAIFYGKMYVPNSDGMNWAVSYGTTASIIDLASFTVTETVNVPLNPERFLKAGEKLYLLAKGNYNDIESAIYEIDPNIATIQKEAKNDQETGYKYVANATLACSYDEGLYLIDAPFNKSEIKYSHYDTLSGNLTEWNPTEVTYPNGIGVDPTTGNIVISSYIMDGQYPSYTSPSFVALYSPKRTFIKKFNIGAGPACIFFQQRKAK
ncbi:MAG: hypothetical protein K2H76_00280, partial [Muribaculaceae bacterium]|nr:hypothetical protein [Muribaculaceae bacterium]